MPTYMVESPHTKEECLKALDELVDKEPVLLENSYFGCKVGDHTEYATVEASTEEEVKNKIPEFLRHKVKITEVTRITPEEIKEYHKM